MSANGKPTWIIFEPRLLKWLGAVKGLRKAEGRADCAYKDLLNAYISNCAAEVERTGKWEERYMDLLPKKGDKVRDDGDPRYPCRAVELSPAVTEWLRKRTEMNCLLGEGPRTRASLVCYALLRAYDLTGGKGDLPGADISGFEVQTKPPTSILDDFFLSDLPAREG